MTFWRRKQKPTPTTMRFLPVDKCVEIGDSETVLQVALSNKIDIDHTCEGMGSCTTCRLYVVEGETSPRTLAEQERSKERGFLDNERLACQLRPAQDLVVEIPKPKKD